MTGAAAFLSDAAKRTASPAWAELYPRALTGHAEAQAIIARLTLKLAAAEACVRVADAMGDDLRAELAALKVAQPDAERIMALAEDYAIYYFQFIRYGTPQAVADKEAAREALRQAVAALKGAM